MTDPLVLGYDEAGSGPVLLLVHGFPLDRNMWSEQLSRLSDVRRVVAVDLRGRGKSATAGDGWTIDLYAEDVIATIGALGVDRVDLAGLSMGGYVAFAVLQKRPDLVRSLLLIDTKAEADSPEAKEGREKTAALITEQGTVGLVETLLPKLLSPGSSDEIRARGRGMFEATPAETGSADALAMRDRPDFTSLLAKIAVPTIVIHGEEDQLMPLDVGKKLAQSIPNASFVTIPAAGHISPLENPNAVNNAIKDFLAKVEV